jgi:hypothetical protein
VDRAEGCPDHPDHVAHQLEQQIRLREISQRPLERKERGIEHQIAGETARNHRNQEIGGLDSASSPRKKRPDQQKPG